MFHLVLLILSIRPPVKLFQVPGEMMVLPLAMLRHGNNPSNHAKRVRDEFKEYFNCEGEVGWQWDKCM